MRRFVAALAACVIVLSLPGVALADPPDNDDISTPRVVAALPYSDGPYDTTEATTGTTDPGFCFDPERGPDASTVWYSFTPASGGSYVADTFGSDYDTTLYVGTPDGTGGIDVINCTDDTADTTQSAVAWVATAGTEYLLMVGTCCGGGTPGEAGGGGTLQFQVDVAPPPPSVELTVAARGGFTKAGGATITGTLICENAEGASIEVLVTQRAGRVLIRGGGESGINCDGTTQPWSVDVAGDNGLFRGGRATVEAFVFACGALDCAEDFESRVVKLRKVSH